MSSPTKPPMEAKKEDSKAEDNKNQMQGNKNNPEQQGKPQDNRGGNQRGGRGGYRGGGRGGGPGDRNQRGGRGGGGNRGRGGMNRGGSGGGGGDRRGNQGQFEFGQGGFKQNEPQMNVMAQDTGPKEPKKFTGRCRLFVGNVTSETSEEEFKELFSKYGETGEMFLNGAKGFGFIRLDYRHNAEAAKAALDGSQHKGRTLRVRFSNQGSAIKVKNLSPFVSNELLEMAMQQFGEIERAVVVVDDRGRSTGEGIVEFARKPGAQQALKRINDGVFLLTSSPRPISAENLEAKDEEDGLSERFMPKNQQYQAEREKEPRFAPPGSFEYRFGLKYREIDEMEKQQIERVKQEMDQQRLKLENEMEGAMFDFQAEQIRADLLRQQEELRRLEEMKTEKMRRRQEFDYRFEEEQRLMMDDDRQQMIRGGRPGMDQPGGSMLRGESQRAGGGTPLPPPPAPPAGMGFDTADQNRFDSNAGSFGGSSSNFGGHPGGNASNQGGMFGNNRNMGGMGNRNDRRRDMGNVGGPRDDYGDMKRMRRF
ncbi:non-POU domain-containing octamer-binding protein-like isoform X2 [Saccostrea echinata]|uniref:non-POU domain-containing octamer-binding protein-like isoform X2 n=1 Tax=Saccostrea echinata TaxID=191078 RepID=UPI002A82C634|nr:non-POU domain-containing octamer-binding protein-like isoform X2 [Saccostrea echinata]